MHPASPNAGQPLVIFLHYMKTGGTTLRRIIRRQYPPGAALSVVHRHFDFSSDQFDRVSAAVRERDVRLVQGHIPFGLHERWQVDATYVTLLRDLYLDAGYELDPAGAGVERYPFHFPVEPPEVRYGEIDTLIFIGGQSGSKGFPWLLDAVERVLEAGERRLTRLLLLGPEGDGTEGAKPALEGLASRVEVLARCLPRRELQATLREHAGRALCVLPYRAANHPLALLDAVAAGCPVLATRVEGFREMVPEQLQPAVLCDARSDRIADGIARTVSMPAPQRREVAHTLFAALAAEQASINRALLAPSRPATDRPVGGSDELPPVTLVVPIYRTDLSEVRELVWGINQQSVRPREVVFVDDGSGPEYVEQLEATLAGEELVGPWRIVRREVNGGTAVVRNAGAPATEYLTSSTPTTSRSPTSCAGS
jgi:glycosyltransferase involved in cell wall biosynthesis